MKPTLTRVCRRGQLAMATLMLVALSGCAGTVRIRDLLDRPQEYQGRNVRIEGTVTRSAGLLGAGAYEVDDGTGTIFVVAQGGGVPQEGGQTRAEGRFESLFNLGGRTIAAIVQEREEES